MKILGIDPGTATTGYGIVEVKDGRLEAIDYGIVSTTPKQETAERLRYIYQDISNLISFHCPDQVAVEQLFFNTNTKTALAVGEARGVILLAIQDKNLKSIDYTPLQVKQAVVGHGRAEKHQVQYMVKNILKLEQTPKPDDAADALAIAICHAHSYQLKELERGVRREEREE
ncbi:MAG: crossover junction endodeoxyribonuclease RuvC [Actinobacteria bacterium]|nr:MAG: crossover junction endodeoxyribonuclease RuvC [Actinomycetota bacterium]